MLPEKNKLEEEELGEAVGGFSVMALIGKHRKKKISVEFVKDTGVCPRCGEKLKNTYDPVFPYKCSKHGKFTGLELVEADEDKEELSL